MIPPIGTVVIPAHNEERALERCLSRLLDDRSDRLLEVIVVANGCTDGTAEVARSFADRGVRCIETGQASKAVALRLGDAHSSAFPRIYLDADVVVSHDAVMTMCTALRTGPYLAAAPHLHVDTSRAGRLARMYLQTWSKLPVFTAGYIGSGCYALSVVGRARFGAFPDVMSDDQFVNDLFAAHEKLTLTGHALEITPPRTLRGIIRRSLRVRAGRLALVSASAPPSAGHVGTMRFLARQLRTSPRDLPSIATFAMTQILIAGAARGRRWRGTDHTWLRDDTSRTE